MANLQLTKATKSNGIWQRLRAAWEGQLKGHHAPAEWAKPHLDHAESIVMEDGKDARYGIYVASAPAGRAPYEGFVHVNLKLPGTSAAEIRLVWNRLAPKYQLSSNPVEIGEIQGTFISGALNISSGLPKKPPVKMFLGNTADMGFGRNFALIAGKMPAMPIRAVVKGNWLHISWNK